MHILVEIVHPADVLFFLRPIRHFQARGDKVTIVSRHKDVACELLDGFGLDHQPISTASRGLAGLARELISRELALWRIVRRDRPQVMLGFGGVAISHVGRLTGIPSSVFYDSENARLQTRITWPFVSGLTVPEDYDGPTPKARTRYMKGVKELSFFYPSAFRRDRRAALVSGLDPDRPNVFVRIVDWRANHDIGKSGWTEELAQAVVARLSDKAKLHVSAENNVPEALKPYLWQGDPGQVHQLVAHCDALIGESATMASEAAVLGVPSIYAGVDFPGYTKGLERRGLVRLIRPEDRGSVPDVVEDLLRSRQEFDKAHAEWLADVPDWADEIVREADRLALILPQ